MSGKRLTRKEFVVGGALTALSAGLPTSGNAQSSVNNKKVDAAEITLADLEASNRIAGVDLSDDDRKSVLDDVKRYRGNYNELRKQLITNAVSPPLIFTPLGGGSLAKAPVRIFTSEISTPKISALSEEDIAFLTVRELGLLLRSRQISSVALTHLYLNRLKKYGDRLLCVITLTEERALREAERADKELARGKDRGPLHGIPYGIKDLFAAHGYPTTWGAGPFEHQVFDYDSAVVTKLGEAGAVLCAKLSMGALAQDDVWFKGRTHNPWNSTQGSSGSSAGSACTMAAGLVAFTIGTETLGSIVSPSVRCRVTGLRPTFGRVSRFGAMELSWSMDKVGPICRDVEDTAMVLAAICGRDPRDPSSVSRPFAYVPRKNLKGLKVGVLTDPAKPNERGPLYSMLEKLGATVRPLTFSPVDYGIYNILNVDCGSSFDEFTRSGKVRELKNSDWPQTFRAARFIPAVEYLQAQRYRTLLMHQFDQEFGDLNAFVAPDGADGTLVQTNYTGHPQLVIPQAPDEKNESHSISIVGRLYDEGTILAIGRCLQESGDFHRRRPKLEG